MVEWCNDKPMHPIHISGPKTRGLHDVQVNLCALSPMLHIHRGILPETTWLRMRIRAWLHNQRLCRSRDSNRTKDLLQKHYCMGTPGLHDIHSRIYLATQLPWPTTTPRLPAVFHAGMYISIENGNYSEITLKISKLFRRFVSFMKRFIGTFTHKNTPDNHESKWT